MTRLRYELAIIDFYCDTCGLVDSSYLYRHCCYRLPGYRTLGIVVDTAWCLECSSVQMVEALVGSDWYANHPDGFHPAQIESAKVLYAQRRSKPRCLTCGSTAFIRVPLVPSGQVLLVHAGCGGNIVCSGLAGMTHVDGVDVYYDAEGIRLEDQEQESWE